MNTFVELIHFFCLFSPGNQVPDRETQDEQKIPL